jgi:hypothetical protein
MPEDLTTLLEKLKAKDPATWTAIDLALIDVEFTDGNQDMQNDVIQGCLQRACEKHGWEGILLWREGQSRAVISEFKGGFGATEKLSEQIGDSPASAILATYLAAMERKT